MTTARQSTLRQRLTLRIVLGFLCVLAAICPTVSEAQQVRFAVLEFQGVNVDDTILKKLSDQSRIAATNVLPDEQYQVMTREGLLSIIQDMGKDITCLSGACEIEIARNIGADYIVTGDLLVLEETYLLTLKLHDSHSGLMLAGTEVNSTSLLELIQFSQQASQEMLVSGLGITAALSSVRSTVEETCPWGEEVYLVEAKGHYVSVNNQMWKVKTKRQQRQFAEVLLQCDKASAAMSFRQWRNRRKASIWMGLSMVGTMYVGPVALAAYKSKRDMMRSIQGRKRWF